MSKEQHISESQFSEILNKRMDEYFIAITGNTGSGARAMHIKTAQRINIQTVQTQCKKSKLFAGDFWGYGINSICDGTEIHSSTDVENFKRLEELNKHHNENRFLWLLTFKVEGENLFVSIFCIDSATFGVNSNLNTKYDLKDLKNARIRTRGNITYVDFIFENLEKPIHFQIDNYAQGGKLNGERLAEYYIEQITKKAEEIKGNHQVAKSVVSERKLIENEVDVIEHKLRNFFVDTLVKKTGKENYEDIITGSPKNDIRRRIKQHVDQHPRENIDDYKSLKNAIEFADIEHLKLVILKDSNWRHFEQIFKTKDATEKYFNQLSQIRHPLKHSRKLTELVKLEGMVSIEWFNQVL
ncbi:hypothetical protein [Pararhodonellum marinum]|uniref:hypothetical protein n=1 Tax=Pararhodonellum marinum TaxID=2755358 RepID=UPI00188EAE03|nr:hypothetical protein [Pararhodonellum marinum]